MSSPMIKLQSSDDQIVKVEVKVTQCSRMLKDMIEALGANENEVIPVPPNAPHITGDILRKIMQWAEYHKDDSAPAVDDGKKVKRRNGISRWDALFLQVDLSTLFQLIRAAHFLLIDGLFAVTCKTVAKMIEEKTAKEVRKIFNIPNDFTSDEKRQVRRENKWFKNHNDITWLGFDRRDMDDDNSYDDNLFYHVQNMNDDAHEVVAGCVSNEIIVRIILLHFSNVELVKLSFVNKLWTQEARKVMKYRGNVTAFVSYDLGDIAQFVADVNQMNVVPFSGIRIRTTSECVIWHMSKASSEPTLKVFRGWLLLSTTYLSVSVNSNSISHNRGWSKSKDLRIFKLVESLLQYFSGDFEQLTFFAAGIPKEFLDNIALDCEFQKLKVLKLKEDIKKSTESEAYTRFLRDLVSRAPNLQELHTGGRLNLLADVLQGTDAVLVFPREYRYPSDEIPESLLDKLRLKKVNMEYFSQALYFERFSGRGLNLLRASSTSLRFFQFNMKLAIPLMCSGICFENVSELVTVIDYIELEELQPRFLEILKGFDFTRMFPKVNKVTMNCGNDLMLMSPDYSSAIVQQACAELTEPKADRAVNVIELKLDVGYANRPLEAVTFFATMVPSIAKLQLTAPLAIAIPQGFFQRLWKNMQEVKVNGVSHPL